MRRQEMGLIISGLLMGFAVGMETYPNLLLPANAQRNGAAMFISSCCGIVGMLSLFLSRIEAKRDDRPNDK